MKHCARCKGLLTLLWGGSGRKVYECSQYGQRVSESREGGV